LGFVPPVAWTKPATDHGRTVPSKPLFTRLACPTAEAILREAQIVGQLSHPAIVNLFDVGVEETGIAYLVMSM